MTDTPKWAGPYAEAGFDIVEKQGYGNGVRIPRDQRPLCCDDIKMVPNREAVHTDYDSWMWRCPGCGNSLYTAYVGEAVIGD